MSDTQPLPRRRKSLILKISLFATGLSGIVAEYILSTLASYFLGDSIFQWTIVLSLMLFSMGLGSRISRLVQGNLLEKFIFIEFLLSVLVSFSAMTIYVLSAYTNYNGFIIYLMSMLIGGLIGLEIPLVTRLNEEYESLRFNISSVMENDYYGSLLGGLFFAFVGLPYLGLTYTPFILGGINFGVAIILYRQFRGLVNYTWRPWLNALTLGVFLAWGSGLLYAEPIIRFAEQERYTDKVVYVEQSKYQKIVLTQWKNDYWLYLNGNQQFSTRDEELYHEPLVHPLMQAVPKVQDVLILGGGDGIAVKEVLKYPAVKTITLVDLDPAVVTLAKTHPVLLETNDSSFYDPKVEVFNQDAYTYLSETKEYYDVILIDLPDPRTVELGRLYSKEFYSLCRKQLRPGGMIITQSGSPYFNWRAFECINVSMQAGGFQTVQIHNQVITLGEWGWTIGSASMDSLAMLETLRGLRFDEVPTEWINQEAMQHMTHFGKKSYFFDKDRQRPEVNTIHNPVLYRYYLDGNWDIY